MSRREVDESYNNDGELKKSHTVITSKVRLVPSRREKS